MTQVEEGRLFPTGVCEICGKSGQHPDCEARARRALYDQLVADAAMLRKHSLHGARGICSSDSLLSLDAAERRLLEYLRRPLEFDPHSLIEAEHWWFIPEGWIGKLGFIVEKQSGKVFPLGSGLAWPGDDATPGGDWSAITRYLQGQVEPTDD